MVLYMTLCAGLESTESCSAFFFCVLTFFFIQSQHLTKSSMNSAFLHCLWTHKFHFSVICSLKMDPTILFTHLKIILLQCFQFQFSVLATINSIQTNPMCAFSSSLKNQFILLFSLFLLIFMGPTIFFNIIHGFHCIISTNFYFYLQYFLQKFFNFSKIS